MNGKFQVIYGGSFDPPHKGHFEIISHLINDPWLEKLHLVPTFQNPLKAEQNNGDLWKNPDLRLKWIKALVEDVKKSHSNEKFQKLILEEFEYEKKTSSYTIDTLHFLKEQSSRDSRWVLAMGSDILGGLERWKSVDTLLRDLSSVWIFERGRSELTENLIPPPLRPLSSFRIMKQKISPISSTELRDAYNKSKISPSPEYFSPLVHQAICDALNNTELH